mmetsp:Transcript_113415/g.315779  ORF Transcript_113415/g.315779 Transcript_113415/m.315779 type:complete len:126 (+) Transcript_113415:403-780(+)
MLRREEELRLSQEVQDRYAMQPESWSWKWQVTEEVQQRVCQECGFAENLAEGLDLLRSSQALFPGDEQVRQAAHYLRHNIHADCPLPIGSKAPDVSLYTVEAKEQRLHDVLREAPTTVIFAGSHT